MRWGKLYAKYLRSDATGHVQSAVLPSQLGGFLNKTTEFGNHLVFQRAAFYKQKEVTSAVIFLDSTAAFYRALPELVLGPLLDDNARAVWVPLPLAWRPQTTPQGSELRFSTGWLQPWLNRAIADWHSDTFLCPGDPLADLIFIACMTGFIRKPRKCLIANGLLVSMQGLDGNPLEQARAEVGTRGLSWIWLAPRG